MSTLSEVEFQSFAVGDRVELEGRAAPAGGGAPATALSILADHGGEPAELRWRFGGRIGADEPVRLTATTTRCRLARDGGIGTVHRHLSLAGEDGTPLGEGSVALRVAAGGEPNPGHIRTDFCSVPWARELRPLLEANADFVASTTPMDGVICLAAGDDAVQLRIYKGRILDVGRSTPTGPTFTLTGSELAWTGLATAPRNDFIPRTMSGMFTATGDKHEYLRFTKAIVAAWDSIRELADVRGTPDVRRTR